MPSSNIWTIFVGQEFVWAYSSVVIAVGVISACVFFFRGRAVRRQLIKALAALKGRERAPGAKFATRFGDIDRDISAIPVLAGAWNEFKECLIFPASHGDGRAVDETIRNTRDPAQYFTDSSVIGARLNLRLYDAVPGALTGFGILGTFIGLAAGISLARTGLASSDLAVTQAALGELLNGASLAFVTSIAGLTTSILFLVVERTGLNRLRKTLREWTTVLDGALLRVTHEQISDLQLVELSKQTSELQTFNTDLAVNISKALDEKLAQRLSPALTRLIEAMEGLRSDQERASEEMLGGIAKSFSETMSGAAGQEFEAISASLRDLDEVIQNSAEAVRRQEERSTQAMAKLSGEVARTLSEGSTHVRKGFDESMQQMMAATRHMMEEMTSHFDHAAEGAVQSSRETAKALGAEISTAIGEAGERLDNVTQRMATSMESAGEAAAGRLEGSSGKLAERAEDLSAALESAGGLTLRLNSAAKEVRDAALALGNTVEGLLTISPALRDSSAAMLSAGRAVTEGASAFSSFGEVAATATSNIQNSHQRIEEAWETYASRFENVDQALAQVFKDLEGGLADFAQRVNEFMSELDNNTARSIQMLSAAVNELDHTLDDLGDRGAG